MRVIPVLSFAFLLFCVGAVAQPKGASVQGPLSYSQPRTVLKVEVVVEKESIRKGPYARYAQKYLGVVAPLTDKDSYRIAGADISYFEEADPVAVSTLADAGNIPVMMCRTPQGFVASGADGRPLKTDIAMPEGEMMFRERGLHPVANERITVSYVSRDSSYVKVPVDKRDMIQKSAEETAMEAANTIFTIRKRRFDLVSGEAGENVFGAGLAVALRELDRMEQEYLALFYGKRYVERVVRSYDVVPEAGKNVAMVCRFSDIAGLLPLSDLSGTPVMIEFTPEKVNKPAGALPKATKGTKVTLRNAAMTECRIADGNKELVNVRVPVYQFGEEVTVYVP